MNRDSLNCQAEGLGDQCRVSSQVCHGIVEPNRGAYNFETRHALRGSQPQTARPLRVGPKVSNRGLVG
jgi:hypothetical protein